MDHPSPTPLARAGLALVTPGALRSPEAREAIDAFRPDGLLLVAYGELVPRSLLEAAPRPPLNVHPSLLPRHRGAAPVAATILAGDAEAGVSLMIMVERLDAGPVVGQWSLPLTGRDETPELEARLGALAAEVVPPALDRLGAGDARPQAAGREPGHVPSRVHAGRRVDRLDSQRRDDRPPGPRPAAVAGGVDHAGRSPPAHPSRRTPFRACPACPIGSLLPGTPPVVACGLGALALEIVQPEGRPPMAAEAWRHGLSREHVLLGGDAPPA